MADLILLSDWQQSQIEFWLPVPNRDGYDVSSFGRVRNWWVGRGRKRRKSLIPLIVIQTPTKKGYLTVTVGLHSDPTRQQRVQRLIALAFIPNPLSLPDVNHINGIKTDNRALNLEWTDPLRNQRHAWKIGLRDNFFLKTRHYSDDTVAELRRRVNAGEKCTKVADELGITWDVAHKVVHYKSYRQLSNGQPLR